MTILSVAQQVSSVIGVMRPQALFPNAGSDRTARELADLAIEMAQRIAYDTRDWQTLLFGTTFVGDGVKDGFPLPDNFKRLLLTSNVWRSTSAVHPMRFIANNDEWLQRRLRGYTGAWGEWIIYNNTMFISPVMGAGSTAANTPAWVGTGALTYPVGMVVHDAVDLSIWTCRVLNRPFGPGTFADYRAAQPTHWAAGGVSAVTATFYYLNKNCVKLASGGYGDVFMNDGDAFALDERLLKLGMIWQWKANKGSPYAEDMANYQDALANIAGADKPAPIMIDRLPMSAAASVAYPFPIVSGPGGAPI